MLKQQLQHGLIAPPSSCVQRALAIDIGCSDHGSSLTRAASCIKQNACYLQPV